MGLADALNTRATGEAEPAHRLMPATNDPLPPQEPIPPPFKPGPRFDETKFIADLTRLHKGCAFMLDHLYDDQGKAQIELFANLAESVYSSAYAYLLKVNFSDPQPAAVPTAPEGDEPDGEGGE